ncbi:FecR family protein [Novosphingobium terrae]|uniref:FecR family protein n=1 Tax=Novosphingobium terrae TaxID=2726189 RepID=UPI001F1373D2|nr:FecR domain-containing protein [Novosphingobium terrae]
MEIDHHADLPETALIEAADWALRLHAARGVDQAGQKAAFEQWLTSDPDHAQAWALAGKAWALSGEVEPTFVLEGAAASPPPRRVSRRKPGVRRHLAAAGLGAVAACLLGLVALPDLSIWLRADASTGAGEIRHLALADGSQVTLAPDSAIRREAAGRGVSLLKGEAWFDVKHDPAHPFTVHVGETTITDVGTQFDVSLTRRMLAVDLAQGAVRIGQGPSAHALTPGEEWRADRRTGVAQVLGIAPAEMGVWRQGRLAAHDLTMADVIERLDRHYRGAIILTDRHLGERRVTGVYDLDDPSRALRNLAEPYGAKVWRVTPWLIIVSAS